MRSISIKSFVFVILLLLVVAEVLLFVNFYQSSKASIEQLLEENVQAKVLSLRSFLQKNMKVDNANSITAYMDNFVNSSSLIKDIHIATLDHKLLYATDRDKVERHPNVPCIDIIKINETDIFSTPCYKFTLRLFKGLKAHYYNVYVYMDVAYMDSLINAQLRKYLFLFLIFGVSFTAVGWFVLKMFVVKPLELLRQYAYYAAKVPAEFFISEIESIRYSLYMTFKRLKKEQEELYKLSTQDSLSGLYNRLSLIDKVNWLIAKSKREESRFAVIFIDLDDFKNINDTRGHDFGDIVLKKVAHKLLAAVRENDIVSRFGGDEFVVVLTDIEDDTVIINVLERIRELFSKSMEIYESKVNVTASMGIAIFPKDGEDFSTLLKHADIAMYTAKGKGKNNYHFFTESLNALIVEKVHMQKRMEEALESGGFELFYQPKVDIATNTITGCEALIRLRDKDGTLIPPFKFISIAESNGFIIPLGEWIVKEAVSQIQKWSQSPLKNVKVSINISGVQFQDPNLMRLLQENIEKIDPSCLDIELTESVLMNDFEEKVALIHRIKELGVSFSLDDFGTGFSSLAYLKKIPFDTIKIDKSFIDDLGEAKSDSFVRLIINIAKSLGLETVAEGVETKEQLEILRSMECEIYQGYYCSKPLPAAEFEALFRSHKCAIDE